MRLGFAIGVTSSATQRVNGPPTNIFTSGTAGFLYDPAQRSTMFQNAAGTIPVTAANQPVGRINDLSGRGNHAIQSTASARPTYQTDGTRHWLAFDGVNDHLVTPSIAWGSSQATIGVGLRKNADTRGTIIDGTNAPRLALEAPGASDGDFAAYLWSTLAVNATVRHVAAAPALGVLVADFDMSNRTVRMGLNGNGPLSASSASGSGDFSDGAFLIGRRTGSAQFLHARLYGLIGASRLLTAPETAQITAFLNARTGAF